MSDSVYRLAALIIALLIAGIAAFIAYEIAVLRRREFQKLLDAKAQADAELEGYRLMLDKYEKTRILRHDLKEQIGVMKELIGRDNKAASEYADKLAYIGRELDFVEYTDNKVLNVLLDRKVSECHEKGIELYIKSNGVSIGFIKELDTVAIFSNLINNAMESCVVSKEKNIFIDFTTLNDAFTVVKIENNCDMPPRTENGAIVTKKSDAQNHGIGMRSIETSMRNYGGDITWSYDGDKRFFTIVLVFNKTNFKLR